MSPLPVAPHPTPRNTPALAQRRRSVLPTHRLPVPVSRMSTTYGYDMASRPIKCWTTPKSGMSSSPPPLLFTFYLTSSYNTQALLISAQFIPSFLLATPKLPSPDSVGNQGSHHSRQLYHLQGSYARQSNLSSTRTGGPRGIEITNTHHDGRRAPSRTSSLQPRDRRFEQPRRCQTVGFLCLG